MSKNEKFIAAMESGYEFKGDYIILGGAMVDGEMQTNSLVKAPLSMLNRHGLIAGATGTGKTKTVQKLCESLSQKGVPTLIMDMKGDLSGISQPSSGHEKITERHTKIGTPWSPANLPTEFLTISHEKGIRARATISEFGPVLFSKILELNDTQSGVVSLAFKYCDDKGFPLLDLKDFKKIMQYITGDGKEEVESAYGAVSSTSVGTIMRKIVELEEQDAELFFGETSLDVQDLARKDSNGNGYINVIRLTDIQTKPKLFSTFMLCLLAEIYEKFPEEGDIEKPKLCIFIDEAHLIFDQASQGLLDQIEMIVKLIRSKGVGVFFITQNPNDLPDGVLGQLGLKIQHSLRAFTAKDRKAIKQASENYPITEFYNTDQLLTELGTGEALITVLDEKGNPTPLVHTLLLAPQTRMDTITDSELESIVNNSSLKDKYNNEIDRESAYEMLEKKLQNSSAEKTSETENPKSGSEEVKTVKKEKSLVESLSKNTMVRQLGRTAAKELTRGLLGVLGFKK